MAEPRHHPALLTSIVVATDFSPGAEWALRRAARLRLAPGARVSLLHVRPRDLPRGLRASAGAFTGHRLERAVDRFTRQTREAGNGDVRVAGHLARGPAFVEIVRHARRRGAELIVLGRHGRRRFRDLVIGSTAQRVVRHSDVPVLLVNREPAGSYRRPLLATDLERGSRRVAEFAARLIDRTAATLSVVHAYEIPFEGWLSPGDVRAEWVSDYGQSFRGHAAKRLNRFVASLGEAGLRRRAAVRRGDARSVVLDEAERRRADLVILGTHGRSGVARTLLGSVAETVVAEARCDVLVARPAGLSIRLP